MDLFGQISEIIGRQVSILSKNMARIIKLAARPLAYLNNYVRAQVKSMTRPPTSKKDYVKLFGVHVSKRFLGLSVTAIAALATAFTTVVYPWLEGRLWTPTILLNSAKMAAYTGPARIRNEEGVLIYQGDVLNGALTGAARQYDAEGRLVYSGDFLNADYDGYGSQYVDGVIRYSGEFRRNLYDGEGSLYDENGSLIYRGEFSMGQRSGRGMEYDPRTHTLRYYGDYLNDVREGAGVEYEEDGVTVRYRGGFSAGLYEGQGSRYEDGALIYQGQFSRGLYEGTGTLYDGSGSVTYKGGFSEGRRQGTGTVYDPLGSALFTGEFLDGSINFIGYLGAAPEDIAAAFGSPGYTTAEGDSRVMTYLNLGTAFVCANDGTDLWVCDHIIVNADGGFLGIKRESTLRELEAVLGNRFSSLTLNISAERALAFEQLSLNVPGPCRVDKYLFSTYYIKLYYDASGETPLAVECGSF